MYYVCFEYSFGTHWHTWSWCMSWRRMCSPIFQIFNSQWLGHEVRTWTACRRIFRRITLKRASRLTTLCISNCQCLLPPRDHVPVSSGSRFSQIHLVCCTIDFKAMCWAVVQWSRRCLLKWNLSLAYFTVREVGSLDSQTRAPSAYRTLPCWLYLVIAWRFVAR
jgi:hypothetical protein